MPKNKVAVLQFEIDRERWLGVDARDIASNSVISDQQIDRLHYIARTAISDTIRNGGTFVLVASKKKITMVQRADVDEVDETALTAGEGAKP
jgi:hypothetical protein